MAYQIKKGRNTKPDRPDPRAELANTLLNVVRRNNERRARELIKKGADVNYTFRSGKTLLLSAICYNSRIVSVLIDAGADVNATDDKGKTALMYCAENTSDNKRKRSMTISSDYQTLVSKLIQKKAAVNKTDENGKTALIYALQNNNEIVADELIKARADLEVRDNQGMTALMYAAETCEEKVVAKLLNAGADVNKTNNEGKTVLMIICSVSKSKLQKSIYKSRHSGYTLVETTELSNITSLLLMRGADVNITDNQGKTALIYAVQQSPSVVEELIKAGSNVNAVDNEGKSALMHYALQDTKKKVHWIYKQEEFNSKDKVALILIRAGIDINASDRKGKTALQYAIEYNKKHLACMLINAGADVNVVDIHAKTSLFLYSSRIGNNSVVRHLVKTVDDINVTDENRKSALIYAVENNDSHLAQEIIDAGADVNVSDFEGKSVLMYALENDDKHLAQMLLDAGADVNWTDDEGRSVLEYALENDDKDLAQMLLDAGADVNKTDDEGRSVLMYALENNNKNLAHAILDAGADVNKTDDEGRSALMYALENNNENLAHAILDAGADVNLTDIEGKAVLMYLAQYSNERGVKFGTHFSKSFVHDELALVTKLIKSVGNIDIKDCHSKTALMYAIQYDNTSIACALIDAGADHNIVDEDGKSALFFAVIAGNQSVVKRFIKIGTALNVTDNQGMTVLMHAVQNSRIDIVDLLLDAGADVNKIDNKGGTALTYCAQGKDIRDLYMFEEWAIPAMYRVVDLKEAYANDPKMISKLIKAGANINTADSQGKTSLIHAVENNRENLVTELVDAGADVNIPDKEGRTALMYCAQRGKKRKMHSLFKFRRHLEDQNMIEIPENSTITKLTKFNAEINLTDDQGKTALILAVLNNNESMAHTLLDAGADHSVIDDDGKSALFYAGINGNETLVKRLVKAGIDLDVTDNQGMTALMHAVRNHRVSVVDKLIDAGCDINMTDDKGRTAMIHYAQSSDKKLSAMTYEIEEFYLRHELDSTNSNIASALIKAGADLNVSDVQGKTALMYALQRNDELLALALVNAGANVNKLDNQGKSALSYCFQSELLPSTLVSIDPFVTGFFDRFFASESTARKLIKAGADVNHIGDEGKTPLMFAVLNNSVNLVNALIGAGADINLTDVKGRTALIHSLQSHHENLALVLIKAGADVNISDHEGQTALFYGLTHEKVVRALIEVGHANVNKKDRYGRSALFYSFTKSVAVTNCLLEKRANLNLKDNCGMNIISFFIEHLMSKGRDYSFDSFMSKLNPLHKAKIPPQTVFEAIINSVFCKILHCMVQDSKVEHLIQALDLAKQYSAGQSVQEKKIIEEVLEGIRGGNLSKAIELLVDLGADPNHADADGNTALHYATCLPLVGTSEDIAAMTMCHRLEGLGVSFNAKNHKNETPLLFCLSKKEWIRNSKSGSKIKILVEVSKFLLENGSNIEETTKSDKSVFHLVLELFQEGLQLNDKSIGKEILVETMKLLKLFPCSRTLTEVAVNKRDADQNSPLHLWAMLELHLSSKNESSHTYYNTFKKNLLGTMFKHLVACGVKVNGRNKYDETPIHLCRSWTAVKLLIDAKANSKVLDSEERSPLLVASKNLTFRGAIRVPPELLHLQKLPDTFDNFLYQDVSEEPKAFWKNVLGHNLDPWAVDNHGKSVLSILIQKKAFDLSKALVEVACEENYIQSDTIAVSLLNAVCQDSSTRKEWKSILVEMILKSRKANLISFASNEDTSLHLCCRNIVKPPEEAFLDEEKIRYYVKANTSVNSAKTSVHWTIAKQLLTYGMDPNVLDASGQSCLDIAKKCPSLKRVLLKPLDIDEVPLAFPWTSISTKYKPILSKVARGQECKLIDSYWYHETYIQKGSFGLVFAGMNEKDGREVAIKRMEKLRNQQLEADRKEITTLTTLADCEQVVRYWSFTEDEHFCYVILELMEGNLNEYLDGDAFDATKSVQLCSDVLSGLTYLHQENILHRDLKPSNILFKTYPKLCLKIADFGLSRRIDTLAGTYTTSSGSVVGTRCWIAPEVFKCSTKKHKHQMASDVFSAGLVLYYVLSGKKHPFSPAECANKSDLEISHETEANVMHDRMEGFSDSAFSPEASDLMHNMLDSDPTKRLTAAMTLNHPFFWPDKKKMDFLFAVGNQPEFECPQANLHKRTLPLSDVEKELDDKLKSVIVTHSTWDDKSYVHMPEIYKEMTQKRKPYNTNSVVELVRFIRNTLAHISEDKRPTLVKKLVLEDFVFLKYFPNLVMEVFKCVKMDGWDSREEIKYRLEQLQ